MCGAVMYAPGDVRVEDRSESTIEQPTDAVSRHSAAYCAMDTFQAITVLLRP